MPRRRLTERQVLAVAIAQGAVIPCYRCRIALDDASQVEREHIHELALGGADELSNMAFSHRNCHAKVTNGTKATSAGSSKQRIAKVRRLRGETKPKRKYNWPEQKFPKRKKPPTTSYGGGRGDTR